MREGPDLPTSAGSKPLDVGSGVVVASFDHASAAWLSIGTSHDAIGFVELSGMPPFDERHRGDPEATRAWRRAMTLATNAFLAVEIDGEAPHLVPDLADPVSPRWRGDGIEVWAWTTPDATSVHQRWRVRASRGPRSLRFRLGGIVDRPALAEITEVDPPAPTGAVTRVAADGSLARLIADRIGTVARIRLVGENVPWVASGSLLTADAMCAEGRELEVEVRAGFGPEEVGALHASTPSPPSDPMTDRALAYIRGCTALRAGPDERVLLTDHRLLPLSWTRDAYWQALALRAADEPDDRERVADHLRWLWRRCERPDGLWMRSHHADGRRKDCAFQADQQLYPFLELADYWRWTAGLPAGVAWRDVVPSTWEATVAQIDRATGLIASHETAADDPIEAPFIAAAQILLWYTAERLAELAAAVPIGLQARELTSRADETRAAFSRFHAAGGRWAYAVSGDGGRVDYHDANDLPIAVAPLWGFCRPDDDGWRATMQFAFSPANPGWFAGRRSGLGSVHTPGPWPLGDVQAWIAARTLGDEHLAAAALARLEEVAFDDGMLPEAYGADYDTRVRHWFAWPGAVLAAVRLLDRDGRLEPIFGVRRR